MGALVDGQRATIEALLALSGSPDEGAPAPGPETVGALDGLGYSWSGSRAAVSVYLFADQDLAFDALKQLRTASREETVEATVNGDLLLWATAPAGDDEAADRIDDLASRFAGEE